MGQNQILRILVTLRITLTWQLVRIPRQCSTVIITLSVVTLLTKHSFTSQVKKRSIGQLLINSIQLLISRVSTAQISLANPVLSLCAKLFIRARQKKYQLKLKNTLTQMEELRTQISTKLTELLMNLQTRLCVCQPLVIAQAKWQKTA